MKTLDEIKDLVSNKNYGTNFYNSPMYAKFDTQINEIASIYAEEMVKHNLKIAAENVEFDDDWIFDGEEERYTIFGVNKRSITNIKIELL